MLCVVEQAQSRFQGTVWLMLMVRHATNPSNVSFVEQQMSRSTYQMSLQLLFRIIPQYSFWSWLAVPKDTGGTGVVLVR